MLALEGAGVAVLFRSEVPDLVCGVPTEGHRRVGSPSILVAYDGSDERWRVLEWGMEYCYVLPDTARLVPLVAEFVAHLPNPSMLVPRGLVEKYQLVTVELSPFEMDDVEGS